MKIWISDNEHNKRTPKGAEFLWQGTISDPKKSTKITTSGQAIIELQNIEITKLPDVLLIHGRDDQARQIVDIALEPRRRISHIILFTGGAKADIPEWGDLYPNVRKLYGTEWRHQLRQELNSGEIRKAAPAEKCFVWKKNGKVKEAILIKNVLEDHFIEEILGLEIHIPRHPESIENACFEFIKLRLGIADTLHADNKRCHPLRPDFPITIILERQNTIKLMSIFANYCSVSDWSTLWLAPGFEIESDSNIIDLTWWDCIDKIPNEELMGIPRSFAKRAVEQIFSDGQHAMANAIAPSFLLKLAYSCHCISEKKYNKIAKKIQTKTQQEKPEKRLFISLLKILSENMIGNDNLKTWPQNLRLLLLDDEWESQCWGETIAALIGFEQREEKMLSISRQRDPIRLEIFKNNDNYLVCVDPRQWRNNRKVRINALQEILTSYHDLDGILLDFRSRGENSYTSIPKTEGYKILETLRDQHNPCCRRSLPIVIFSATNKSITMHKLNLMGIDGQFCKRPPILQSGINSELEWFSSLKILLERMFAYREVQKLEKKLLNFLDQIHNNFISPEIRFRVLDRLRQIVDEITDIIRKEEYISIYYSRYQNPIVMSHQVLYDVQDELLKQNIINQKSESPIPDILSNWHSGISSHLNLINRIRNRVVHKGETGQEQEALYCLDVAICLAAKEFSCIDSNRRQSVIANKPSYKN